jgi:CubicO group peptidase (beta-lactamase class C family)/D-alanyl-D-alanine dipeptidase
MRCTLLPSFFLTGALALALLTTLPERARAGADVPPAQGYETAARALEGFIRREVADKGLPALSIALVDDQTVVWAQGFGLADPAAKVPATADTIYRVGSVSKLFTDLAIMQEVERGRLDLDAPVTRYLPDFKPINPFGKPITLRQLMSHRSGLVREAPVGHYFDPSGPSLTRTVASLNRTELVYPPGARTKYSNAGIAVAGLVLETTRQQPFARYLQRTLLEPLDMSRSSFRPDPVLVQDQARGLMWTYFGREFPAPTFELGMAPAGSMYTTVKDLGRFLSMLFAGGRGPHGVIVQPETLAQMTTPQFVKPGTKEGFGLGFRISELDGRRRLGHGGAIYGFATELATLPDDKLGVVVVTSRDCANAVTSHIADVALRHLLAVRRHRSLPHLEETTALAPGLARQLAGRYRAGSKTLDLLERDGRLWLWPGTGGFKAELRQLGHDLVVDDRLEYGTRIRRVGEKLRTGKDTYERVLQTRPGPAPGRWDGLIGEYGWDYDTLYILEKDGKLHALIEWFYLYPLEEVSENVFRFPEYGLYQGEKLIFRREHRGRATAVEAASVVFERRPLEGEGAATFKVHPSRPLDELRREAQKAQPPREKGPFRRPDLVDLTTLDPSIKLDIRYATTNNFLSTPLYQSARAFLQRPAAQALVRVHRKLADRGYGLLVYDGYRPWSVTRVFWEATPEPQRIFVANPAEGSRHNRGCAVDLTLYDRKTGQPVEMVGGYDEMSDRSWADYPGGTSRQRYHRDLLRRAMEDEGFSVYPAEWWHFDYKDWRQYPILNRTFEQLEAGKQDG